MKYFIVGVITGIIGTILGTIVGIISIMAMSGQLE